MTQETLLPLPEPDTHCWDDDLCKDVWSHSADQMHAYARAAIAARAPTPTTDEPLRPTPVNLKYAERLAMAMAMVLARGKL